ncbi:hypothetical protein FO519_000271 [Halicephalobus sp. NKZ332]|nr:hypothetical protein FO519_000271 [Halicephalobus sp. NKZ332]
MSGNNPNDKSSDFVTPEVTKALNQARDIVTKGKTEEAANVVEESTTVKFTQTGSRKDPVEVIISHSSVVSQGSSDDEGTKSDDDSNNDLTQTLGSRAHENPNDAEKHSAFHYRRKTSGMWEADTETIATELSPDDEAKLTVDVRAETKTVKDHQLVTTTWEARWTVQTYEMLPEWLQDNEYLRTGHRPPLPSVAECFKSIWSIHTETGNIWTHLIGCVAFFILGAWFMSRPKGDVDFQEKLVFSFFFLGAILCLGLSFVFHTLSCHSVPVVRLFSKLDYMGISLLIIGSFIPWIYYGFYCRREPKITYIGMVVVLGIAAIIISLWDKFSESKYRPLRAGVFVGMGCSGIIPTVHFIYTDGVRRLFEENSFGWLCTMAALYLIGAVLYATRTPERFFPGKCDLVKNWDFDRTEKTSTGKEMDRNLSKSGNPIDKIFARPLEFGRRILGGNVYDNPPSFTGWKGLPGLFEVIRFMFGPERYPGTPSKEILDTTLPVVKPDFSNSPDLKATWLGHATVLVQMGGFNFITDPVFCSRASPVSFLGPRRYRKPPCEIEDLPDLQFAVISHNHYDHLDAKAVADLNRKFPKMVWYVPQDLKDWMQSTVPGAEIHDMTWGESKIHEWNGKGYKILCVPAQHWSLRGVFNKNTSLWSGWAVTGPEYKFYYTGDTGFCEEEFRKLGDKYGPFHLAAIPIGCYSPRNFMKSQHINTDEAVEIHRLVKAEYSIGIHWGTYEMGSTEPYDEPPVLFKEAGKKAKEKYENVGDFIILDHGETWKYQKNSN